MKFYDLPNELILEVFKNLSLNDLDSLRRVSVKFKTISELVRINELIVFDEINLYGNFWFQTKDCKCPQRNYSVRLKKFYFLRSIFKFNTSLKRLYLSEFQDRQCTATSTFNVLNELKELEHLELEVYLFNAHHLIKLPKLKKLNVESKIADASARLTVDAITLRALKFKSNFNCKLDQRVWIEHPKSLRYLEANVGRYIEQFENLEHFEQLNLSNLDRGILRKLPRLKVLDVRTNENPLIVQRIFQPRQEDETLNFILSQKAFLRKKDLTISTYGIEIDSPSKLTQLQVQGALRFKINNIEQSNDYKYDDKKIIVDYVFSSTLPEAHTVRSPQANFHQRLPAIIHNINQQLVALHNLPPLAAVHNVQADVNAHQPANPEPMDLDFGLLNRRLRFNLLNAVPNQQQEAAHNHIDNIRAFAAANNQAIQHVNLHVLRPNLVQQQALPHNLRPFAELPIQNANPHEWFLYHKSALNLNLINFYDKHLSSLFSRRFCDLQSVHVNADLRNGRKNFKDMNVEDKLRNFLNSLVCLKQLSIRDCNFSQDFYDNLANFKCLEGLKMRLSWEKCCAIDFRFLFKLEQLSVFKVQNAFKGSSNLAIDLFKRLVYLEIIQYRVHGDVSVRIERNLTNRAYKVKYFKRVNRVYSEICAAHNLDLDQLEDHLRVTFHPRSFLKPVSPDSLFLRSSARNFANIL